MSRLVWTRAAAALTSSSSPVTVFVPTSCSPRPSGPEDDEDASSVAHSEESILVRMTDSPAVTSDVREAEGVSDGLSDLSVSGDGPG